MAFDVQLRDNGATAFDIALSAVVVDMTHRRFLAFCKRMNRRRRKVR